MQMPPGAEWYTNLSNLNSRKPRHAPPAGATSRNAGTNPTQKKNRVALSLNQLLMQITQNPPIPNPHELPAKPMTSRRRT